MRLFFALVPSPQLQQTLASLARDVARLAHGRPVPAENIHLTLAFIGAWPQARLPMLLELGDRIDAAPTVVALDTLGGFRRAGVAWIGASAPPAALTGLAGSLGTALASAGIAVDERAFHPHLTLARKCRGPYPHAAAGPFGWNVDAMELMQSDTRLARPRYTTLRRWPTGGARAAAGGLA